MASEPRTSAFAWVPRTWFEPVVGLWVVLLAGGAIQLSLWAAGEFLRPLGAAPWAALVVTVLTAAFAHGLLGVGVAVGYRRSRGFEPPLLRRPGRAARRWLAGLVLLAPLLMVLGGLASSDDVVRTTLIGFDLAPYPEGIAVLSLDLPGVNGMVGQAPLVLFGALLALLLAGPAVGGLFHGVLQDTLARVASRRIAIVATATAVTVILGYADGLSAVTAVVFAFALAVAYAYRETGDPLTAMAAYGAFDALALVLAWLDILASLHAAGHLVG